MPDTDKTFGRAVVLVGLVVVAAVALRGYLPGAERAVRQQSASEPGSLVATATLLLLAVGIELFALVVHLRQRRTSLAPGRLPGAFRGDAPPRRWRYMLIALAALVVSVVLGILLARLGSPVRPKDPPVDMTPAPPSGDVSGSPPKRVDPTEPPGWESLLFGLFIAASVVMMLVAATARRIAARRQRAAEDTVVPVHRRESASAGMGSESLVRVAEIGLAEITDVSREPRAAIIACYAAMERELARVPEVVPQDFDTPTEVLARAVDHRALRTRTATRLVDLFEEARFSSHVMTEEHREVAVRVLQLVLAELRSAT